MISEQVMPRFITNLGAGISPADFIPTEEIEKVNKEVDFKLLNLLLFGSVMVAVVIIAIPLIQLTSAKAARDRAQANLDEIIEIEQVMVDYYNALDINMDAETYYNMTKTQNAPLRIFIEALEQVMPSDMAVGSISADGGAVTITGTAESKESVAKLLIELKKFTYVEDVSSGALTEAKDENGNIQENFSITCKFTSNEYNGETGGN